MNNNFYESSYLHYLAGVINEDQYHEILGFNLLSRPDTDKGTLGLYDINFDNPYWLYNGREGTNK